MIHVNGDSSAPAPPPVEQSLLPPAASSDLVLEVANPVEWGHCTRLNGDEWKGPLTNAQYIKREQHLMSQDLTKDGRETGWILTSRVLPKDQQGNRPVLAACETIPIQGYVARDGKLEEVLAQGIGSVFTRKEHRGRGYAARMMTELAKTLETWQQPTDHRSPFSVLYSDIGQKFYSQFGWKPYPSTHIHLASMDKDKYAEASQGLPAIQDLSSDDLGQIPATQYAKEELIAMSKSRPGATLVAIAPGIDHFTWHHAREEFVSATIGQDSPDVKGAIHRPSGIAMIWTRTFAADPQTWGLHILHTAIPPGAKDSEDGQKILAALLLRAQLEAHNSDMVAGVEVWDPSDLILAAARSLRRETGDDVEVIHRDEEHVCSLRWNAPDAGQDLIWAFKHKYAWC